MYLVAETTLYIVTLRSKFLKSTPKTTELNIINFT